MTGLPLDAQEARLAGLVNVVVPEGGHLAEAERLAGVIARGRRWRVATAKAFLGWDAWDRYPHAIDAVVDAAGQRRPRRRASPPSSRSARRRSRGDERRADRRRSAPAPEPAAARHRRARRGAGAPARGRAGDGRAGAHRPPPRLGAPHRARAHRRPRRRRAPGTSWACWPSPSIRREEPAPADAIVAGLARIDGRKVCIARGGRHRAGRHDRPRSTCASRTASPPSPGARACP